MSYEIGVDPKIEMLGILEYFADPISSTYLSEKLIDPSEKEYIQRVERYFSPFLEHPALQNLRKMKELGFKSDQAVRLLLYHSQIPYLFSQPMIQNQKHLEWIQLLRLWIDDTKFPTFFEKNKFFYQQVVSSVETPLKQIPLCDVVELFFGERRPSYHIYASSLKTGNYNVFLPNKGIALMIGSPIVSANDIYPRIIHEFTHCFVRPAIDLYWSDFQSIGAQDKQVGKREAVYELVAQAVQEVLVPGSIPPFTLLSILMERITEFQARRDLYPTFSSFIPHLAKTMKEN